ncbi:unnamed protein product [marine sediment metagenome]|uniref:Uncharacterized protein n=1 Tax=marine sediment metagenome TaxID=412755 RepID=X0W392_9ZZZZ
MKYSIHCQSCGHNFSSNHVGSCINCCSKQVQGIRDPAEVRKENDLKMIRGELPWPCAEILGLKKNINQKKKDGDLKLNLGILVKGEGPKVIFANVFEAIQDPSNITTANSKTYPSYEAIIKDGWRVD